MYLLEVETLPRQTEGEKFPDMIRNTPRSLSAFYLHKFI